MLARLPALLIGSAFFSGFGTGSAFACGACRPSIRALILTPDFPARFASMLAPVAILLAIGALIHATRGKTDGPQ